MWELSWSKVLPRVGFGIIHLLATPSICTRGVRPSYTLRNNLIPGGREQITTWSLDIFPLHVCNKVLLHSSYSAKLFPPGGREQITTWSLFLYMFVIKSLFFTYQCISYSWYCTKYTIHCISELSARDSVVRGKVIKLSLVAMSYFVSYCRVVDVAKTNWPLTS